jgi:hypothetical protein
MLIDNIEVVEENAEEQQPVDVQEEDYSDVGKQSEPAVEDAYDSIEEKTARLPLFSSIGRIIYISYRRFGLFTTII